MISPTIVIITTISYLFVLFGIAYFVERKYKQGKNLTDNALIYTLALAIYCTAWTFYGNVGMAATSGYLFIGVYIGPTLFFVFWWGVLRKLIRIRNEYNITSIADFISARYGKSSAVAAIASTIALVGIVPYLSLQLKAIFTSYVVVTTESGVATGATAHVELIVLAAIIIFIIAFGLRRLDQTERHPGMVMVVAIQSIIKIAAFLGVGIFVTYFLYHGFGDIFSRVASDPALSAKQQAGSPSYSLFMAYTILSFSAIMFLPRQFHMAVVENTNERYVRTAVWLLPLYFILITVFVLPLALAGILKGYDIKMADNFILMLPLKSGNLWLSLLVFIGGFSAAISMIMISAMTITTMVSNHLILPLFEKMKISSFLLKHLLPLRWIIVILVMGTAYMFEQRVGSAYLLVKIGMISFAAVLQFAPAIIGALFWKKGNKAGATMGLSAGFTLWIYTSLVPAFVKSGWINDSLLTNGPYGIKFLRPEHLFGITSLDPLAMIILSTMLFNIGFYILGSLFFRQSESEIKISHSFIDIMQRGVTFSKDGNEQVSNIDLSSKIEIMNSIFGKYLGTDEVKRIVQICLRNVGIAAKDKISVNDLVNLNSIVEKTLASYIGSASASEALSKEKLFTEEESEYLSGVYVRMAADLKLSPEELSEKVNYAVEKGNLLKKQGEELEKMVRERTKELEEKNRELEKFQEMTVGRELKMAELKEKMKELESKASSS